MRCVKAVVCVAATLLALTPAKADDAQFIKAANTTWSAFQCAAFSGWMNEQAESDRLMNLGLTNGRFYYTGAQSEKHKLTSIFDNIPNPIWLAQLNIISPDFSLGNVWVDSTNEARKVIGEELFRNNELENARMLSARKAYERYNCSFLQ